MDIAQETWDEGEGGVVHSFLALPSFFRSSPFLCASVPPCPPWWTNPVVDNVVFAYLTADATIMGFLVRACFLEPSSNSGEAMAIDE